jgi:hypothetical protein
LFAAFAGAMLLSKSIYYGKWWCYE